LQAVINWGGLVSVLVLEPSALSKNAKDLTEMCPEASFVKAECGKVF
jgi:hypothetical protein